LKRRMELQKGNQRLEQELAKRKEGLRAKLAKEVEANLQRNMELKARLKALEAYS